MIKQNIIEVPFLEVKIVPDPSFVYSTWDWYFLDQVSSTLLKWDQSRGSFRGLLAESWKIDDVKIEFELKGDIFFQTVVELPHLT
jgi:hypothetical protein